MSGLPPYDFRWTGSGGREMIADVKTEADREDAYSWDWDEVRWKVRMQFGMYAAITAPLANLRMIDAPTAPVGVAALEALGRYVEAAERRCEAAIEEFHRRPGWGALWLAVKWGFLSGWRRDRDRAYLVSFDAGKAEPDVVVVENIGSGRS